MSKTSKKIIGITAGVIAIIAIIGLIIYSQLASAHNQRVDAVANEINDNLSELTMDLTQDSIDTPTAFKYLVELSLLDNGEGVEETALTYYDGSKAKYNEINALVDDTIDAYQVYFKSKNEGVLTQNAIDVAAASKAELTAAIEALNKLVNDLDTQNVATRFVNSDYGIIFGDNEEVAKVYFDDLKARVTGKLGELQTQLDNLNAAEAAAAAQAAAEAAASAQSKSNSYSNSSNNNSSSSQSQSNDSFDPWSLYGTKEFTDWMNSHGGHIVK